MEEQTKDDLRAAIEQLREQLGRQRDELEANCAGAQSELDEERARANELYAAVQAALLQVQLIETCPLDTLWAKLGDLKRTLTDPLR